VRLKVWRADPRRRHVQGELLEATGSEEPLQAVPAAPVPDQRRVLVTQRVNSASKPDTSADNVAITTDLRSCGPSTRTEPVTRTPGVLCAALDPRPRPHQPKQANAAHNPALLIRVRDLTDIGQRVHALQHRASWRSSDLGRVAGAGTPDRTQNAKFPSRSPRGSHSGLRIGNKT